MDYYPKCFDIGNVAEFEDFVIEYEKNIMRILLEKVYAHMYKHSKELVEEKLTLCRLSHKHQGPSALRSNSLPIQIENSRKSNLKTTGIPITIMLCMVTSSFWPLNIGVAFEKPKSNMWMINTTFYNSNPNNSNITSIKLKTTPSKPTPSLPPSSHVLPLLDRKHHRILLHSLIAHDQSSGEGVLALDDVRGVKQHIWLS